MHALACFMQQNTGSANPEPCITMAQPWKVLVLGPDPVVNGIPKTRAFPGFLLNRASRAYQTLPDPPGPLCRVFFCGARHRFQRSFTSLFALLLQTLDWGLTRAISDSETAKLAKMFLPNVYRKRHATVPHFVLRCQGFSACKSVNMG